MEAYAFDWLNLLLRWVHLITGIAWIGASFYFVWLDNSLQAPKAAQDRQQGVGGELWAVHGGGFYHVQKYRVAPAELPSPLHWFKWEAYATWLSGFALFVVMYYANARAYMIDPAVADLAPWQAIAISIALLGVGWVFYDQLCKHLGLDRDAAIAAVMVGFVALVAWGLSHAFSGRAMFIQVGAMLGTMMVGNVAHAIIPAQRELVRAKERNEAPDPVHGRRGKQRSVHNNYFTLPVLLVMISGHYPMTWGHSHAWLVLVGIVLVAAFVRHFFNLRHRGRMVWGIPVLGLLATAAIAVAIAPSRRPAAEVPSFARVQAIVHDRCASCHAERPSHAGFSVAPKGVLLDTPERIVAAAARIGEQSVTTRAMPIGNLTGMTDAERTVVGAWIAGGARR